MRPQCLALACGSILMASAAAVAQPRPTPQTSQPPLVLPCDPEEFADCNRPVQPTPVTVPFTPTVERYNHVEWFRNINGQLQPIERSREIRDLSRSEQEITERVREVDINGNWSITAEVHTSTRSTGPDQWESVRRYYERDVNGRLVLVRTDVDTSTRK